MSPGWNGPRNQNRWCAPVIAGLAKSTGILTVRIVTTPFLSREGRGQLKPRKEYDLSGRILALILIPNDKLLTAVSPYTQLQKHLTWPMTSICKVFVASLT
ncbi:hypothetical protein MLD38_035522 [Melastoma candidum]|uniref:Uncharacterized protein n=1 Tax=Melastoma candidum TaxID=119954 RepID=A0ACB9LH97_9MYRT|nr:hypothetical protein MLD38_035522 [Melastoma candidum]